jgi:putative transposase
MDAILTDKAEQLAREIATQAKTLDDLNGLMKLMMKSALERMLDTELDVHLGRKRLPGSATDSPAHAVANSAAEAPTRQGAKNRRNGHSQKTVQGDLGEIKLTTPRDRDGTFEPQLIPKHQRRLTGFDEKILALYAKGMTTRDIQEIVIELYGVDVSPTLISEITADLDAQVAAWRHRQLDPVWPIVYFDGIVVHVRGVNGRVSPQTMYVALGVNMQGRKELLGLWLNETEGAKFWLSCLTDLKNRGLKDIFIACIGCTHILLHTFAHERLPLRSLELVQSQLLVQMLVIETVLATSPHLELHAQPLTHPMADVAVDAPVGFAHTASAHK